MNDLLRSLHVGRAFIAGVLYCILSWIFVFVVQSVLWTTLLAPLFFVLPVLLLYALNFIITIFGLIVVSGITVVYFYAKVKVTLVQTVFLGIVAGICINVAGWISNLYQTITDPSGVTYVGAATWGLLFLTTAVTVCATYMIKYLKPQWLLSENTD